MANTAMNCLHLIGSKILCIGHLHFSWWNILSEKRARKVRIRRELRELSPDGVEDTFTHFSSWVRRGAHFLRPFLATRGRSRLTQVWGSWETLSPPPGSSQGSADCELEPGPCIRGQSALRWDEPSGGGACGALVLAANRRPTGASPTAAGQHMPGCGLLIFCLPCFCHPSTNEKARERPLRRNFAGSSGYPDYIGTLRIPFRFSCTLAHE